MSVSVWLLRLIVNNFYLESLPQPLNSTIITQVCLLYSVHVCIYVKAEWIVAVDLKQGTEVLSH